MDAVLRKHGEMELGLFDYHLPPALIAQFPAAERTASRLLTVAPKPRADFAAKFAERAFGEVATLLRPGDIVVVNDTRVVPARLQGRKPSGGAVEILLERILGERSALVQLGANRPIRVGQELLVNAAKLRVAARRDGFFVVQCQSLDHAPSDHSPDMASLFQTQGSTPLPPYIHRAVVADDAERYQTVYAKANGAVAAPTAGLHFDQPLIDAMVAKEIHWATITLHVGAGTFTPVRAESLAAHRMHREWVVVDAQAVAQIRRAKSQGGRVIAVGTTVVRALECAAQQTADQKTLAKFCGDTELFIRPGYRFRVVDALITNFHLPRSTLLMLVCAFAGYEKIMDAYGYAIAHGFRFYSYGDAMFVERDGAPQTSPPN